jgi:tape measure domain-containing protein
VAPIDDKVVAMSFESSKFEQGVDKTIHALEKLKDALRFPEAGKGLTAVSAAAKEVDLGHIHKGVDEISNKLGALRLAAIAVFSQIASKAIATGSQILKGFTVEPIIQGFREYETQINAVQTILSNTQAAGTQLKDVSAALDELNEYADKTIYNFSEMTRNIGTFTAAGVDLQTSVASIKGIANLAAVSGSNAQQASTAMYQLSQAISSGTVKLMDWNSVVNAGMGGTVFQRALAQTAEHMGTLKKGAVELEGPMKNVRINGESFRNSLSAPPGKEGWLSGKVLTETLKQLSGDMTDAQLKAQGYTDAQIKAIQVQAQMAVEAATKVKTFTQLMSTTKEQLGSGWAQTWRLIFGDFGEAKVLFTGISDALGGFIMKNAEARNKVLQDWKKLGGRKVLISALKDAFQALADVVKPIKQAFRDIFPAKTGKDLFDITVRLKEFTQSLKPSPETIDLLRRTFRGLFAILDIGKQIIGGIFSVFGRLFGQLGQGSGGFLTLTARIGDWLVKVDQALKKGKYIENFFERLGDVLATPIAFLQELTASFGKLFSGAFTKNVDGMTKALSPLQQVFAALGDALSNFASSLGDVGNIFTPIIEAFVQGLQQLGPAVANAISGMSFEPILQVIRTGLLAGIFLLFKNFLGKGSAISQITKGFGGGILANISKSFGALSGSLTAMQQNLKAKTLKEIAIAVALLAASMVALSFVDPKRLNSALTAITIAFGQLLGAMAILGNVTKTLGFIKMPVIASTLIILAGAILVLSAAVAALSLLSWEQLAKGLTAVGILLGGIVLATAPLSAASFGMVKAGIGLMAIAVALNILALAVRQFGSMNLMQLGKGLASIGLSLFIIATYIKLMPSGVSMVAQGAGLIAIAVALNILALAVRQLGSMNLATLGKGMAAIGISLAIIAGAMRLMPTGMVAQAAALLLVAAALQGVARAIGTMGGMSIEQLAKGLGSLAVALGILGVALIFMEGTAAGAAALGIAAAGISLLATSLVLLGKQSIKTLVTGLIALAAALGIIAGIGILLDAAIPGLLAFGAAVALIGAGLLLAGAGIGLAAAGVAALVAAIVVAAGVVPQAFEDLTAAMIDNAKNLVLGLLEIVQALADTAPQFVDAIVKILDSVIDALIKIVPKLDELVQVLITHFLSILAAQQGPIIQAGMDLLLALLQGIRNNIGQVVTTVVDIIVNFINAIRRNVSRIITAGASLIIAFLSGIAKYYAKIVAAAISIITRFLGAIASGLGRVVTAGGRIIASILTGIANNIRRIATAATNVIVAFINGIGNAGPRVIAAATNTIIKFINALQQNASKLVNAGVKAVVAFLNGIAKSIETYAPQMRSAGLRIGIAIVDGMTFGLVSKGRELLAKAGDLVNQVKSKFESAKGFLTRSPSKYTYEIGQNVILGLAKGLSENGKAVDAAGDTSQSVIDTFKNIFEITSPSKVMQRLGRDVAAGFAEGIKEGAEADIRQAFQNVNTIVAQQISAAKQKITAARSELNVAEKGKKLTREQIVENAKLNQVIEENNKILQKSQRFHKELTREIKAHKGELFKLSAEYEKNAENLEKATSLFEQYADQYDDLPEIPSVDEEGAALADPLSAYIEQLTRQVGDVEAYSQILASLKGLGLDDKTYKALLDAGPKAGMAFAKGLLAAGKPAIDQISALDVRLDTAAGTLADNAAKELYDVGDKAAQGFVLGLQNRQTEILAAMDRIADGMVDRIKKKLKIKSPSEVFAELGQLSMEGMAKGLEDSTGLVTDAADQAAKDALTAMEQSMRDISDVVTDQLEANPVITPILDLSQVKAKQAELAALTTGVSSGYAASISTGTAAVEETNVAPGGTSFKFEQNNYSPEALTDIEIYRQTKNQLSQIKAALALT